MLAAMALLGQLAYLDALYWNATGLTTLGEAELHPALRSAVITGAAVTVIASITALAMTLRHDRGRGARPFGVALAAWGYLLAYSGLTLLMAPDPESALRAPFDAHFLLVEALGLAALLRFTALFPEPLGTAAIQDPATLHPLLRPAQHVRAWLLRPASPWLAGAGAWALVLAATAAAGRPVQDAALIALADVLRLTALAVVVLNLKASFVAADTPGRRAGFWFVVGFTLLLFAVGVLLGGNVLTAVTRWGIPGFNWRPVVLDLGVLGLIWGAYMGITYRGALKPGPVARHAAVLASAVTVGLFLAAGLESVLTGVISSPVEFPRGVGTAVAALATGLLYARVRRPVESMIFHAWADRPEETPDR